MRLRAELSKLLLRCDAKAWKKKLSLSALNAVAQKGQASVAKLTLVFERVDGYGCWDAKGTRKTKQLL